MSFNTDALLAHLLIQRYAQGVVRAVCITNDSARGSMIKKVFVTLFGLFATCQAMAACELTDSAGQPVTSGTGLTWQIDCPPTVAVVRPNAVSAKPFTVLYPDEASPGPFTVVRPDAASTGPWMARSVQWKQDFYNRSKSGEKVVLPPCGTDNTEGVFYLVELGPDTDGRVCTLRAGSTLLLSAYETMSIGGSCEAKMKMHDEELLKHAEHFAVFVDEQRIPQSAYWRNEARQCFAFESPFTGFSVQVGNGKAAPLATGYVDGFWTMLRFDVIGTYVLRRSQPPHKKWAWQETYSKDDSYTIQVIR